MDSSELQKSNIKFLLNSLQAKTAQQGKQMWFGAREVFAYRSVKLVLLANGNRYEPTRLIPILFFPSGKALHPFKIFPCPNSDLPWHTFISVVCALDPPHIHKKRAKNIPARKAHWLRGHYLWRWPRGGRVSCWLLSTIWLFQFAHHKTGSWLQITWKFLLKSLHIVTEQF